MATIKIMTDHGELSIKLRQGYYYAVRTWNRKKRQIYLGKHIPDMYRLNEIAKDIFSSDREFYSRHSSLPPNKDIKNSILEDRPGIKTELLAITAIAKARGEDLIEKKIQDVIKQYL